jgi:type III pantothenate kinase
MLLAVDIGNTFTKFGVFENGDLRSKFAVETDTDDLVGAVDGRLDTHPDAAVVCSVVPEAAERVGRLFKHGFKIQPTWVDSSSDFGLEIKHRPRVSMGADRLVNSFAAAEKYGPPVLVLSFGTATTIDFVNEKRVLVGGLIAPGMSLMAKTLREHTAKLPEVDAKRPKNLLGASTEDAIRSGIYLSAVGLVETAVDRVHREFGDMKVVATGGFAKEIAAATDRIEIVDEDLTLYGLANLAGRLNGKK